MSTLVLHPDGLTPEALDDFLARGWYRIGPTLVTSRFLWSGAEVRSTLWTRLPLEGYRFRRSLRRRIRRVEDRFRVTSGPYVPDAAHEALYARYLTTVDGDRSPTLEHFLFGGEPDRGLFDTREVALWDGDRLVAFSLFDVGRESVESLIGAYEPSLARFGLGFYTLLAEIRWALERGFRYHYSGYVLPGDPMRMAYKLDVGDLEYLHPQTGEWCPWSTLDRGILPTVHLRRALSGVRDALRSRGLPAAVRPYPMFEAPAHHGDLSNCLDQPLFVECTPGLPGPTLLAATWDLDAEVYRLLRCMRAVGQARSASSLEVWEVDLLVVVEWLGSQESPAELAAEAVRHVATRGRVRFS